MKSFPQHQLAWGIPNSQCSLVPIDSLFSLSACLFQLIKDVDNSPVQHCHSSHFDPVHHYCTCCHKFFQIPHHYQHCHGSRTSSASLVCQWDRWCLPPAVHPWFRGRSSLNMVIGCLHLENYKVLLLILGHLPISIIRPLIRFFDCMLVTSEDHNFLMAGSNPWVLKWHHIIWKSGNTCQRSLFCSWAATSPQPTRFYITFLDT